MGADMAREGLAAPRRLAAWHDPGSKPGMAPPPSACWNPRFICVTSCCATATGPAWGTRWNCARRWWMQHCWKHWGHIVSGFAGGAGKAMLAQSPKKPLPDLVVNRPKTGFSLPMASVVV